MFIGFPPRSHSHLDCQKTYLPTHPIFYSQRLFDMEDGLPKYAKHKEETPTVDEEEDADRSQGQGENEDKQSPKIGIAKVGMKEVEKGMKNRKRSNGDGRPAKGTQDGMKRDRRVGLTGRHKRLAMCKTCPDTDNLSLFYIFSISDPRYIRNAMQSIRSISRIFDCGLDIPSETRLILG